MVAWLGLGCVRLKQAKEGTFQGERRTNSRFVRCITSLDPSPVVLSVPTWGRELAPGGGVRPQVVEGQASVSVPRWGREAPGGGLLSWRETPGTPEGGGPWGYHLSHITATFVNPAVLASGPSVRPAAPSLCLPALP